MNDIISIEELREDVAFHRQRADLLEARVTALVRRLKIAEELAAELEQTNRLLTKLSVLAYKPGIEDHIPFGLADEVKKWVKGSQADIILRQWQEVSQ